jgi:AcrR family transcriptional regulator
VSEAASKWEARRVETTRRVEWCALELTRDKGFDGWTMDDLATAAEVSRRTVFNYFDSKADVVLGPVHEVDDDSKAAFVAGGPTGHLFEDFLHIALLALTEKSADMDLARLRRAVVVNDPRVVAIAHERFETVVGDAIDLILEREGTAFGALRARLLVQILVHVFDSAVQRSELDLNRPFPDLIAETLRDVRDVLGA